MTLALVAFLLVRNCMAHASVLTHVTTKGCGYASLAPPHIAKRQHRYSCKFSKLFILFINQYIYKSIPAVLLLLTVWV